MPENEFTRGLAQATLAPPNIQSTLPLWMDGDADKPEFLTRTKTEYWHAPFSILAERGLENQLLNSLVDTLPDGTIIAGGFMTAVMAEEKNAQDIDLFFTSSEAFVEAYQMLLKPPDETYAWGIKGYTLKEDTIKGLNTIGSPWRSIRFVKFVHPERLPIQLLKLAWYDSAEHVIDSFDLTVAQFAVDVQTNQFVANPASFMDLVRKRLVLHRMQFPSSTLRRIIKYSKKGFYACPGALAKIAQAVHENIAKDNGQFVYVD